MTIFQQDTLRRLRQWAELNPTSLTELEDWAATVVNQLLDEGLSSAHSEQARLKRQWVSEEGLLPVIISLANVAFNRESLATPTPASIETNDGMRKAFRRFTRYESVGRKVAQTLNDSGVNWAMMKGYVIARRFYDQPFQRDMRDIDLLVSEKDFIQVRDVLFSIGGQHRQKDKESAQEMAITIDSIEVDLHNQVMRASRLRHDSVPEWLGRTQSHGPYRYLSDHDELLTSLVHPAVTEYLTLRNIRMLDVVVQIARCRAPIDWPRLADDIRRLGLANAAYATGIRVNHLFATDRLPIIPNEFLDSLGVDRWRQRYWCYWLERRPDKLYKLSPMLAQALFGIWLNDAPGDWARVAADVVGGGRKLEASEQPDNVPATETKGL